MAKRKPDPNAAGLFVGWRRSRKDHMCVGCHHVIPKGTKYWRRADGDIDGQDGPRAGAYCKPECEGRVAWANLPKGR